MKRTWLYLTIAAGSFLAAPAIAAQDRMIDLRDPAWELTGEGTRVQAFDGQTALRMRTGEAIYRDIAFQDGTIEFDLQVTGVRAFAFLEFRVQDDRDAEQVYVRPHNSDLPDALQYNPVHQGLVPWQLYHGPGGTAAGKLPAGSWFHVRLVVNGRRAALFVGDTESPQLLVRRMAQTVQPGFIVLSSFFPAADDSYSTSFANLVIRPDDVPFDFDSAFVAMDAELPTPEPLSGWIREWSVSPAFAADDGIVRQLPEEVLDSGGWQNLPTEPDGMLVLDGSVTAPSDTNPYGALVRVFVDASRAGTRRLDFGFSDFVTVFLNGRALFSGDNSYSFDAPRRLGLISIDQGTVYLPLTSGRNELVFAVSEVFGGWGLMARFEDMGGLRVTAD